MDLKWFWNGNIWTQNSIKQLGGPQCANDMTKNYKLFANLVIVNFFGMTKLDSNTVKDILHNQLYLLSKIEKNEA